jgi:hypothetical protein
MIKATVAGGQSLSETIGRGERIRTSDLTVPKSVTALLLIIFTYYTVLWLHFHSPFHVGRFRPQCYAMRLSVIP